MAERWQLLAWPAGAALAALGAFALRRPLTHLVTAAFAVPYSLTAELLAVLQAALDAYRGWWREQFALPSVRALLGSALLGASLPALLWAEMHLQAPTVDALLQLEQGTIALPFLATPVEVTPGQAFVVAIVVMEMIFGIFLLDGLGATHFFPLADASADKRKLLVLAAAAALFVCCASQGALTAWRAIVTQEEMAVELAGGEPDGALVVGSSELFEAPPSEADPAQPTTAALDAPAAAPAEADAMTWLVRHVPWAVPAMLAFLLPLCAAAAGLAFYHLSVTLTAACAWIPILALALVGAVLNWVLRAVGVAEQLVQRLLELLAALGATLVGRRPPDHPMPESPEAAAVVNDTAQAGGEPAAAPGAADAPSEDGDTDVIQAQMEEIENLRDQVRDHERRERRARQRVQLDPLGVGAEDDSAADGRAA
jgi:hypothetical protein